MIVITAPTGNIGHQVLSDVLETDAPVRVIVRDTEKLPETVRNRVEVVEGFFIMLMLLVASCSIKHLIAETRIWNVSTMGIV